MCEELLLKEVLIMENHKAKLLHLLEDALVWLFLYYFISLFLAPIWVTVTRCAEAFQEVSVFDSLILFIYSHNITELLDDLDLFVFPIETVNVGRSSNANGGECSLK